MKVMEKATDRRAEAHIYIDGQVKELEEYGEYIDSTDKAICCYVPVEEGHRVKIGGRFSGTTLIVAFDTVVDGVYRKASSYAAKTVHNQKHKKIDTEKFLYRTEKGIVDTEMHIAPLSGVTLTQGEGIETIGTMELRLYVTRQIGVNHALTNIEKYSSHKGNVEDDFEETATYKQIEPTFRMTFEKNCAPLEKQKSTREQRRMETRRPGTEPWAIFRFHYRSIDTIVKQHLTLTRDPNKPSKTEPHTLALEPVPPLPINMDGDSSTRTSTPMSPSSPLIPVKGAKKELTTKSPTLSKKHPPKPTSTDPASKPKMTLATTKGTMPSPDFTPALEVADNVDDGLPACVVSPNPASATVTADKVDTNGDSDSVISTSENSKDNSAASETLTTAAPEQEKSNNKPSDKPIEKERATISETIVVALPRDRSISSTNDSAVKASNPPQSNFTSINGTSTKITTKEPIKSHPQVTIPPPKKPATAATPVTPTKRTAKPTIVTTPETKRAKIISAQNSPTTPTIVSRIPLGTPSPRPMSIEREVAERRKKLEALRLKRLETARKQEALDKQMEPFKKRMAEELERLSIEMMEEEAAAAEDEEHMKASIEMLAEFEQADGGD